MTNYPKIPIVPDQRSQQRAVSVVEFPLWPKNSAIAVGYQGTFDDDAAIMPKQKVPRSPTFLFQAEWASTPIHGSVDAYYIQGRRHYWLLWDRYLDDNEYPWTWPWMLVGFCDRKGIDNRTAAMNMVLEYWAYDCEDRGEFRYPYEWINEEGFLNVSDVEAIVRELKQRFDGDDNEFIA